MTHHRTLLLLPMVALGCLPRAQPAETASAQTPKVTKAPAAPRPPDPPKPPSPQMEGTLDMERLAGGKMFQGTWIHLDSGSSLLLSYRPVPEYFRFVEKRVVFTGEHYFPKGQAVGADHFRIATIKLAPGEKAHDPSPTALLRPPIARTRAAVVARDQKWVQVLGTLLPGRALPDDRSVETSIRMSDGSIVFSRTAQSYYDRDWKALEGKSVTSLGRLVIDHSALRLGYNASVCAGEVDGCGMPKEPTKP